DCFMLDELVTAAQQRGIYLQLCMLTRDVYMSALKDPASSAYAQAIDDAKKFFRYAVGRWGYATSVAAWEYWNEMDPGLPTDRFYSELGSYFEEIDPYRHLRTTSTWGPSAKDCRHPKLDIADVHFYLRPPDYQRLRDEVDAVVDRTRWLREQAPNKPAHLGEFGIANEKWLPTEEMKRSPELVEMHHAFWSSALSGASSTALPWWWERLDQKNVYPLYRPVSAFVADVPWNGGEIKSVTAQASGLHVVGLQAGNRAWLWLLDPAAAWGKVVVAKQTPGEITAKELTLSNLPPGKYHVTWWDTRRGIALEETNASSNDGALRVAAPQFTRDIACKIIPQE
ncbi:MAG TPA: hypothetical protein VNZ22_20580, partial [Bacillota bacterium]|nr:hypothetical protein [Bacillota bacterium]